MKAKAKLVGGTFEEWNFGDLVATWYNNHIAKDIRFVLRTLMRSTHIDLSRDRKELLVVMCDNQDDPVVEIRIPLSAIKRLESE